MQSIPCLTLHPNTERPITITHGTNRPLGPLELSATVVAVLSGSMGLPHEPPPLWDRQAGQRIADVVAAWLERRSP